MCVWGRGGDVCVCVCVCKGRGGDRFVRLPLYINANTIDTATGYE